MTGNYSSVMRQVCYFKALAEGSDRPAPPFLRHTQAHGPLRASSGSLANPFPFPKFQTKWTLILRDEFREVLAEHLLVRN